VFLMPAAPTATARLLAGLERSYRRAGLVGRSLLLAVSGGADSRALLVGTARLMPRLGLRVEVATLDHGLRPGAAGEVERVCALARAWGVPCHVQALGLAAGPGLEARARAARYAALEALRRTHGLEAVATAHTASDQAETLLMRLVRGTTLRGARGVHARRGHVVRPLLAATRGEVEAFLAEQGLHADEDPMNNDRAFLRVRVRRDVLPALDAAAGFPVTGHLAAFARLAAEDEALLAGLADAAFERTRLEDGSLDAVAVRALEPAVRRRVVGRLLAEAGVGRALVQVEQALQVVERGGRLGLGRSVQLRCAGGRVRCVRLGHCPGDVPGEVRLEGPGAARSLPGTGWHFAWQAQRRDGEGLTLALGGATRWPLTVRTRRAGDRVTLGAHSRSLQDLLVDARVPAEARAQLPVVADRDGRLLWVPGVWSAVPQGVVVGYLSARAPAGGAQGETL
jgi:tRNA(Ile)-lysidine synthase